MSTPQFLGSIPLFRGLSAPDLDRIAEVTRLRDYPRGSVIVFEHDPGDALFVVRAGRVKVVLVGEDGREVILGVLGVGEHFGELALIDDQPRSAHVIAMEDAQLLVLRRDDFRRLVEEAPALAWARGADVLVHDATYTADEIDQHRGWGHSTDEEAVDFALEAGVRTLVLFHHQPDRDDDAVDRSLQRCRERVQARGATLTVLAAYEGLELDL